MFPLRFLCFTTSRRIIFVAAIQRSCQLNITGKGRWQKTRRRSNRKPLYFKDTNYSLFSRCVSFVLSRIEIVLLNTEPLRTLACMNGLQCVVCSLPYWNPIVEHGPRKNVPLFGLSRIEILLLNTEPLRTFPFSVSPVLRSYYWTRNP